MTELKGGAGLLNRTIDALPVELHLPTLSGRKYQFCGPGTKLDERLARGEHGINRLDALCRSHDIAYRDSKDTVSRNLADKQLANRAWEVFKSKDTPLGEKVASWLVTTIMNAKSKLGAGIKRRTNTKGGKRRKKSRRRQAGSSSSSNSKLVNSLVGSGFRKRKNGGGVTVGGGGGGKRVVKRKHGSVKRRAAKGRPLSFGSIIRHAKAAIRGAGIRSSKAAEKDKRQLRMATLAAVKAVRNFKKGMRVKRSRSGKRILPLPKTGGVLPLLPIFAGLSALGSLSGGVAGIIKSLTEAKDATRRLSELQRHNKSMEDVALQKGKGLFLKPHPKGGLGLYMNPYTKYAKNY